MNHTAKSLPEINPIILEDLKQIALAELPWVELRNKSVLVTGGGGFLPAYLVKSLLAISQLHDLNINVICVVRNTRSADARPPPCQNDLLHLPRLV